MNSDEEDGVVSVNVSNLLTYPLNGDRCSKTFCIECMRVTNIKQMAVYLRFINYFREHSVL